MHAVTKQPSQPNQHSYEANREQFEALCSWIHANAAQNIGWQELYQASGWTHKELMELFAYFVQTTPMTYIRMARTGTNKADKPMVPSSYKA